MNIRGIIKGSAAAFIIFALSLTIGAALTYFNLLGERAVSIVAFAGAVAGVLLGSLIAAKISDKRALLNSLAVSVIFSAFPVILSAAVNGGMALHIRTIALLLSIFAAGFIGAVAGK